MHYVYVLKRPNSQQIYIGYSSNLKQRIVQHQQSEHPGWKLVYYEAYLEESDARRRERRLKVGASAIGHLKNRISASMLSETLERVGSQ